ncbi:MAG: hypothetical protein U1F87_06625 [Kiritimatiellia bacterium]
MEAMLRDGLNEPAWKASKTLFKAATNAGERAGAAAILGARAALGMGKFETGLHQIDLAGNVRNPPGSPPPPPVLEGPAALRAGSRRRRLAHPGRGGPPGWDPFRGALLRLKARCLLARGLEKDAGVFEMASKSPAGGGMTRSPGWTTPPCCCSWAAGPRRNPC